MNASPQFLLVQSLTAARLPLAAAFSILLLRYGLSPRAVLACLVILLLSEASDILDGILARRFGVVSSWGQWFDPYLDSVSRLVIYWSLAVAGLALAILPLVMALRDVTVAYARLSMTARGGSVQARLSGKIKAGTQAVGAIALLLQPLVASGLPLRAHLSWIILAVTAASAIEYISGAFARSADRGGPGVG